VTARLRRSTAFSKYTCHSKHGCCHANGSQAISTTAHQGTASKSTQTQTTSQYLSISTSSYSSALMNNRRKAYFTMLQGIAKRSTQRFPNKVLLKAACDAGFVNRKFESHLVLYTHSGAEAQHKQFS
jgi:hypothetical protein